MDKAKRSLIRIERIDGETVMCSLDSDDDYELLAIICFSPAMDSFLYWNSP